MRNKIKNYLENEQENRDITPKSKRIKTQHAYDIVELKRNINLQKLDFELPVCCSINLSTNNIYCCLQCGNFFQGRSQHSPAFQHSITSRTNTTQHNLFVNLQTTEFFWLPQNIKVNLDEIDNDSLKALLIQLKCCIKPTFNNDLIKKIPYSCYTLIDKDKYITGFIGINQSHSSNLSIRHINVILLLLAHIKPIRDYFLLSTKMENKISNNRLINIVSLLIQKLWSPVLLRPHISSSELINNLMIEHNSIFLKDGINNNNPRTILNWLINKFSNNENNSPLKQILIQSCRGHLIQFLKTEKVKSIPFWNITLNLPRLSYFKDGRNVNDLLQVQLEDLIKEKFYPRMTENEKKEENDNSNKLLPDYEIKILPKYLIIYFNRYDSVLNGGNIKQEQFPIRNRNQTIIEFPMKMCLTSKNIINNQDQILKHYYRLQSNIINEVKANADLSKDDINHWKIQIYNEKNAQWYEICDLKATLIEAELMFLKETYLQVWERIE